MTTSTRRRRNPAHDDLMAGYYAIREAEEAAAEATALGWDTETAEWFADHPRTTFKQYLIGLRGRWTA